MEFKFKSIIFFLLTVVLLSSCTDDDAVDPTQTADLGIEITASDEVLNAGTNVTFTLTATNNGPLDATEVTVVNKIPSGYTYVSAETTSGEYDSETGNWAIEDLDNETTATLTIVGTVNASGDYQNKAMISGNEKDIQPANNSAMVSVAPKAVTNDMLFQYTISDAPNPEVTITGLSPLWQELDTEEKYHITIPTTLEGYPVTVIGNAAFEDQENIISVIIPEGIKLIDTRAFNDCYKLESINIPGSVEVIGLHSFSDCEGLKSITLTEGIKTIGPDAFAYCKGLTEVTIPNTVTSIGSYAFSYCSELKSVSIPNSVTEIETRAFYDCEKLTLISLPNQLSEITTEVLSGCSSLENITIPASVTSIEINAFRGCSSLTSIEIPASVKEIGAGAFVDCTALTSLTVAESNDTFKSVEGVLYNKTVSTLLYCPTGKAGSFTIPNTVTAIDQLALAYCKNLTQVVIPNSVTHIYSNAFRYCTSLTTVTIPASVKSIGFYAFADNPGITKVIMNPATPPLVSTTLLTFANCRALTAADAIQVPGGSLEAYETAAGWSDYKDVISAQ
ncbi:leucine-rich repeat protein [Flavobacterium sp. GA093]|uniref:Leucine-rich repeat protein n=1 Tax=Flavobacterium hydrocarbonoxydans TaxID=2683249 RepID=A0A6I4NK04_9FLAO|nr:leucine-rich repeat protein [Flavobacterium hydrocarbonoxydans]MWB94738.1 leucine-rich repeat protein [Flavobacterium hydrocarbonoxydans]